MIFFVGSIGEEYFSGKKLIEYYNNYYEIEFKGQYKVASRMNFVILDNNEEADICLYEDDSVGIYGDLVNAFWLIGREKTTNLSAELAAAYITEGMEVIQKLAGDFSFVLVDFKKEKVFLIRDQFGIKQLFWSKVGEMVVFSNFLYGLKDFYEENVISQRFVEKFYNNNGLLDFTETPYINVDRVRVASYIELNFRDGDFHDVEYWSLISEEYKENALELNEDEWAKKIDSLIETSVNNRRKNKMSLLLSGGLDSTTLFSYLSTDNKIDLKTFSAVFDELSSCDEREYINELVEANSKDIFNYVNCDNAGILEGCPYTYFYTCEPHVNVINKALNEQLFEAIRNKGYRYVVDGFFADHIFSGSIYYVMDELEKGHFLRCFQYIKDYAESSNKNIWDVFWEEVLPVKKKKIYGITNQVIKENGKEFSKIRKYSNCDLIVQIRSSIARNFADFELAPRYGLECIHPFVDLSLVKALYEIPGQYKCSYGVNKEILRKVSGNRLPTKIVDRVVKTNHTELSQKGLRDNWGEIYNVLSVGRICNFDFLNMSVEEWKEKIVLFRSGKVFDDSIWILISLEMWLYSIEKRYGTVRIRK